MPFSFCRFIDHWLKTVINGINYAILGREIKWEKVALIVPRIIYTGFPTIFGRSLKVNGRKFED